MLFTGKDFMHGTCSSVLINFISWFAYCNLTQSLLWLPITCLLGNQTTCFYGVFLGNTDGVNYSAIKSRWFALGVEKQKFASKRRQSSWCSINIYQKSCYHFTSAQVHQHIWWTWDHNHKKNKNIKNKIIRYQDIKTQKVLCANYTVSMR